MVTRIVEEVYDDLDGTLITGDGEQLRFTVDGATYELDVNVENAAAFRAAVAPYIEAARRVRHDPPRALPAGAHRQKRRSRGDDKGRAVREWARANGHTVGDFGKLPAELVAAYDAAQRAEVAS